uniref:Uncharacterized protein n=1 Tax=Ditylenchus dipsaci TaxID=166011 RepID=A0A915CUM9_9BILA
MTKEMLLERNNSVNKSKNLPSDDRNTNSRPINSELQREKSKRKSQGYALPKMTQSAFDQVVEEEPISKKHFKGGKLSVLLEKLIREKEYQTTISRAIISSAESDYRAGRREFIVDNSAEQHASYSAWGTQMVEVSDSVRLALRQNERAILRPNSNQKKKFSLMPSKEVFRAISTVIKISSADSKRVLAGYVKT